MCVSLMGLMLIRKTAAYRVPLRDNLEANPACLASSDERRLYSQAKANLKEIKQRHVSLSAWPNSKNREERHKNHETTRQSVKMYLLHSGVSYSQHTKE